MLHIRTSKSDSVNYIYTQLFVKWVVEIWNWAVEDAVAGLFIFGCYSVIHTKLLAKLKVAFNKPVSACLLALKAKRCKNSQWHDSLWSLNNTSVFSLAYNVKPLARDWSTHTHVRKRSVFCECTNCHWSAACNKKNGVCLQPEPADQTDKKKLNFIGYSFSFDLQFFSIA